MDKPSIKNDGHFSSGSIFKIGRKDIASAKYINVEYFESDKFVMHNSLTNILYKEELYRIKKNNIERSKKEIDKPSISIKTCGLNRHSVWWISAGLIIGSHPLDIWADGILVMPSLAFVILFSMIWFSI